MITTKDYAHVGRQTYAVTLWGSDTNDQWVVSTHTARDLPTAKAWAEQAARERPPKFPEFLDVTIAVDNWVDSSFTDPEVGLVRDASSETDPDSPQTYGTVDERGRVTWPEG